MPSFRVNGSHIAAQYQFGSRVLLHDRHIYNLKTPLDSEQIDYFSINSDLCFRAHLKDGSELVLEPKSREERVQYHSDHKLKLRALKKKHAKKALQLAKLIERAAKGLIKVQKSLHAEAVEIAGEYYQNFHRVTFELEGSNKDQIDCDGYVTAPDFESVLAMARGLGEHLEVEQTDSEDDEEDFD